MLFPLIANGGGFELRTAGQKASGMGGAYIAVAGDATAVYFNPGAMGLQEMRVALSGGGMCVNSRTSFRSNFGAGEETPSVNSLSFHFYGSFKVGEKFAAGIGMFSPFGYHVKWEDAWEGRFVSQESKLAMYSVQPTVSYAVSEHLGLGVGLLYSFGKWENRKAVPAGNSFGTSVNSGNGKSIGVKAGLFLVINEDFKAGLTYRSPQEFKIDDGEFSNSSLPVSVAVDYPVAGSFSTSLKLPGCIAAGASYRFTEEFLTTVELDYTQWSGLKEAEFKSAADSSFNFTREFMLENSLSGRLGAQYAFTEAFELRGGFGYDISPFNSNHLLAEYPDANKIIFTLGATFRFNDYFSADISGGLENFFERQGNDQVTGLNGTYKTIRYQGGLSLNLNF